MPATATIALFVYAVILGGFGAPLWAVAVVGGLAVLWQVMASLSKGFVPPAYIPPEDEEVPELPDHGNGLTDEERRALASP